MMKLKNGLSLVLSLVLVAQLCLPVGAVVAGNPATNPSAEKIVCTSDPATCPDCNPELPDLGAPEEGLAELTANTVTINTSGDEVKGSSENVTINGGTVSAAGSYHYINNIAGH